ncbi:MAG: hypothetical protein Ta2A_24870 [Treponemataceae bacterium]|nr:MAG: hypothetical protein Ta2A_24870 [Treponemataceae bacterium]
MCSVHFTIVIFIYYNHTRTSIIMSSQDASERSVQPCRHEFSRRYAYRENSVAGSGGASVRRMRVVSAGRGCRGGKCCLVVAVAAGSACWVWLSRREVRADCGYRAAGSAC